MRTSLVVLVGLLLALGCKKDRTATLSSSVMSLPDAVDVKGMFFLSEDTGFVCGGQRGSHGNVYATTDGGATWSVQQVNPFGNLYSIHFSDANTGFAGGNFLRLFKTTDGGTSWSEHFYPPEELPFHEVHRPNIHRFEETANGTLHFVGGENYETGTHYRSSDNGAHWQFDTVVHELRGVAFADAANGVAAGFGYVATTADSGATWNQQTIDVEFFTAVEYVNANSLVACGYNGGLYRSTNGGADWNAVVSPNGVVGKRIAFLDVVVRGNDCWAVGNAGVVYRSVDSGASWSEESLGSSVDLICLFLVGDDLFIGGADGKVFVVAV